MKKSNLLIFSLVTCLAFTEMTFSQSITNTLGTGGVFTIKDASTNFLTLSQSTGEVNILKSLRLENTINSTSGVIYKGTERFLHNYGFGSANTFLGINSGNFTMTGGLNTGLGYYSLTANTSGSQNTAIGYQSLIANTSGSYNTAVGRQSLNTNSTGNYNTAIGWLSLFGSTGNNNTAVGSSSLFSNSSGTNNTSVGMETMLNNYTGSENTAIGYRSLYYNNGTGNTAVGYNSMLYNMTGFQNTALGHHSLQSNSGNFNTAVGYNSGSSITSGFNLTCIGIDAAPTSPTANNQVTLGNGFVSSLRCNVTTITSLSDARDKKNIAELTLGLDFISKLKPRQYNWDKREWYEDNISDGSKMQGLPTAGFIAQELDEAQTNQSAEWLNLVLKDNPEKWEATPGNLLPVMVKAIQELKIENDKLRVESVEIKSENEEMIQRLLKLEQSQDFLAGEIVKIN
jgi:trimeric autotransporter adhesin